MSISGLGFRVDKGNNLIVPFYTLHGHFMSGWQKIWGETDSENKWPKTTRKGSSNKDVYLKIGKETDEVNIAEGPSTALSIFKITKRQTYIVFGKNNLHNVTEWLLNNTDKIVILCIDKDKVKQYIPLLKHKRLKILCPDKEGDFNDFQDVESEIQKLKKCHPVWEAPQKELPKDAKELKQKLDNLGYEIRINTRADRIEVKGFKGDQNKWSDLIDEEHSLLFLECKGEDKLKKTHYEDQLKAVASAKQVDPFEEYLKELVWDKKNRLEGVLFDLFDIEDKYKDLAKWGFKSLLLAAVRRTFKPGAKHDELLILRGEQGLGKSSLLYHLFEDKSFFSNSLNFSESIKNIIEGTLGKTILEIAELQGFGKAAVEKMKNVISSQQDTSRLAWRKNARDYKRRCVFCGTTNDVAGLPNDLSGLRRFVVLEIKKKKDVSVDDIKKIITNNRDQLWAEAMTLYQKGESARLPKELWATSAEISELHRGGNHAFEEAFLYVVIKEENRAKQKKEDEVVINVSGVLKILQDGEVKEIDGKSYMVGGKWIKEISPKYGQQGGIILEKRGYEYKRRWIDGQKLRVWIKKIEKEKVKKEVKRPKMDVKVVKNSEVKPEDLGELSDTLGPFNEVVLPKESKPKENPLPDPAGQPPDPGQPPF